MRAAHRLSRTAADGGHARCSTDRAHPGDSPLPTRLPARLPGRHKRRAQRRQRINEQASPTCCRRPASAALLPDLVDRGDDDLGDVGLTGDELSESQQVLPLDNLDDSIIAAVPLTSFSLTRISSVAPASRTPSWPERSKQAVAEHLRLALLLAGQLLPAVANEVSELGPQFRRRNVRHAAHPTGGPSRWFSARSLIPRPPAGRPGRTSVRDVHHSAARRVAKRPPSPVFVVVRYPRSPRWHPTLRLEVSRAR